MDGVLVDGEPLHFEAVNHLLGEEGRSITLEAYKPYMGTKTGWRDMLADNKLAKPDAYYNERYNNLILDQYERASVPTPGSVELVRALERANVPLAVASSSRKPWVEACLTRLGILEAFAIRVTGGDVVAGKPAPDIYLKAAERLGIAPNKCLAIEDAPAGIQSAKNAGMTVWAVRTEYTRDLPLPSPHREFESLVDVQLADIVGVAV